MAKLLEDWTVGRSWKHLQSPGRIRFIGWRYYWILAYAGDSLQWHITLCQCYVWFIGQFWFIGQLHKCFFKNVSWTPWNFFLTIFMVCFLLEVCFIDIFMLFCKTCVIFIFMVFFKFKLLWSRTLEKWHKHFLNKILKAASKSNRTNDEALLLSKKADIAQQNNWRRLCAIARPEARLSNVKGRWVIQNLELLCYHMFSYFSSIKIRNWPMIGQSPFIHWKFLCTNKCTREFLVILLCYNTRL